jgi:beta-galactosidase
MLSFRSCSVFAAIVASISIQSTAFSISSARSTINFNRDWKFFKGNPPGAEKPEFVDSAWQNVRLPHDWAIAGPFNPREQGGTGKLPWKGEGWYRKTFVLDTADSTRRVYFDFDGVMAFPKVYVNGRLAGQWDYGYMSFRVDATPFVRFGKSNSIAVYVDTRDHVSRWYPGAGIYRKVTMTVCDPVHVAHWGIFVTTPMVTPTSAKIRTRSTVGNHSRTRAPVIIETRVIGPDGKTAAKGEKSDTIPADSSRTFDRTFTIASPLLWEIRSPRLYTARTSIRCGGKIIYVDSTAFGIRTARFSPDSGFFLNGKHVQIQGVCLHHDQGPLGAAFNTRAMERQLQIMRSMGVNGIRTSHNPPAPGLLELCDRMGFVVWDELFDKWDGTADRIKGQSPFEPYVKRQALNWVMRDRNHPSVVIWSIGNEIPPQPHDTNGTSPERVKFLTDCVRASDSTRPVTMASDNQDVVGRSILDALDAGGWNYGRRYMRFHQQYPKKSILYSESASALSTRGFYELPLPYEKTQYSRQAQVDSYDFNAAPWSDIPDAEFALMEQDKFVAGDFVWTGFDYLGEPTPFFNEARSSFFGIVDLCGIPKDRYYLYRSHWRPDTTTIHIVPHWNWPDRIGKTVPVLVYTNGDSAVLFLNGKSLGGRKKGVPDPKPANLASGKKATASSEEPDSGKVAGKAIDGKSETHWCAGSPGANQWWQMDLGKAESLQCLTAEFESGSKNYAYRIKASADSAIWQTITEGTMSNSRRWAGPERIFLDVSLQARFLRIEFTNVREGMRAGIKEFAAYASRMEPSYYDVTCRYRLRWNNVAYAPGELKAVAYNKGKLIGESTVRTAEKPASIRLTPDRKELAATGEDLCYLLVESVDAKGTICPLADNAITFTIDGPADLAGADNGDPQSLEPFQSASHRLFKGKAMLVIRTREGKTGTVRVTARSEGLLPGEARMQSK